MVIDGAKPIQSQQLAKMGFADRICRSFSGGVLSGGRVIQRASSFAEIKVETWEVVSVNEAFAFDKSAEAKWERAMARRTIRL